MKEEGRKDGRKRKEDNKKKDYNDEDAIIKMRSSTLLINKGGTRVTSSPGFAENCPNYSVGHWMSLIQGHSPVLDKSGLLITREVKY